MYTPTFMKKQIFECITPVIALMVSLLPGCKKASDLLKDNPTAAFCPCRIREFNYDGLFQSRDIRVNYNAAGDPVFAGADHGSTGNPNWFFRYNPHGSLTDLIGRYDNTDDGFAESWDRYFYDGHGRIVKDSAYFFPHIINGQPTIDPVYFTSVEIILYEYDHKDRISKESLISTNHTQVTSYAYDVRGNRMEPVVEYSTYPLAKSAGVVGGMLAYDNKINYHRTSKVWMFVDKDYSVNNPLPADYAYNGFGLPVTIVEPEGTTARFLSVAHAVYEFKSVGIRYDCQGGL
jgi:hypothetical protein